MRGYDDRPRGLGDGLASGKRVVTVSRDILSVRKSLMTSFYTEAVDRSRVSFVAKA